VAPFARTMTSLETRVPPPLVMLCCAGVSWALAGWLPTWRLQNAGLLWCAIPVAVCGLALNLLPKLQFARAATTVNPLAPHRATQLVSSGLYRYSRNPMYLGQALLLLAWTLLLQHPLALVGLVGFVAWVTRLQIVPEERVLSARFPAAFARLSARTRRWL